MSNFDFGDGQYLVYAKDAQSAGQILGQELKRFDRIKNMMANLLTENGPAFQNFMNNTFEDRLNIHFNDESSSIYDIDPTSRGMVRQRNLENGIFYYDLAYRYPEIQGHNADFRLAHEMGHLMLNPSTTSRQVYDKETNSTQISVLIRRDEKHKQLYGEEIQENTINLIAQLAIRGDVKADDIITGKVDLSEFNLYKKCDDLVRLLAISMRNDFDEEMSFEQLANQKLDSMITLSDGTERPANTFFYGMLNDSSMVENEFDKYMGNGAWRQLNDAFAKLYKSDMPQETFEAIFEQAQGLIKDFANVRFQDRYQEAVVRTGGFNVPSLDSKLEMIDQLVGLDTQRTSTAAQTESSSQGQDVELPEGYSINEFGEILRPDRSQEQTEPIVPQNENRLTFMQKIAQSLQKNKFFMNLSFVKNFVDRQLNVLPAPIQETRPTTHENRTNFLNTLSNNGDYKDLPPIQRMSDPKKLEQMRAKMEGKHSTNDGR